MTLPPLAMVKGAASRVLLREVRPMHYAELTRECLYDLGIELGDADVRKVAEDLREKALQAGAFGMAYLGRPHCLAYLREWFAGPTLLNHETVRLDVTAGMAIRAGAQAALRIPHMLNKYGSTPEHQALRVSRGLLIEAAVRAWAQDRWPSLYLPPDNDRAYHLACNHDFKFRLRSHGVVTVDVAGPNATGGWGAVPGKPGADFHILAADEGLAIAMHGVMAGARFHHGGFAEQAAPLSRLVVLLNCELGALSYFAFADAVRVNGRAAS